MQACTKCHWQDDLIANFSLAAIRNKPFTDSQQEAFACLDNWNGCKTFVFYTAVQCSIVSAKFYLIS